jgi:hypothetical protein
LTYSSSTSSEVDPNLAENEQIDARRTIRVDDDEIFSILDLKDGR